MFQRIMLVTTLDIAEDDYLNVQINRYGGNKLRYYGPT